MRAALIVAIGGAIGAGGRWGVGELIATEPGAFPWATLLVNLVGCLAIGVAASRLTRDSDVWHGGVVGLLGGLTTYSAFAVETRALVEADRPLLAVTYVVTSVVGGIVATEAASRTSRR